MTRSQDLGVAERKLREKERRRHEILDAAEALFDEKGLQQATMDDVAERTELSKGTLYLYFRNKDALYLGINLRAKRQLRQMMEQAFQAGGTGRDKVRALGAAYLAFCQRYPNYHLMMSHCHAQEGLQREHNLFAEEAHLHGERALGLLVQALQEGQSDGSLRRDFDPLPTAILLWAQLQGLMDILEAKGEHLERDLGLSAQSLQDYALVLTQQLLSP